MTGLEQDMAELLGPAIGGEGLEAAVVEGLGFDAFVALAASLAVTEAELAQVIDIPKRTLARRRRSKLSAAESDRLARVARVTARAEQVFGSRDKAVIWLGRPNRGLAGATPLSRLGTDLGAAAVEAILGRIVHGIFG